MAQKQSKKTRKNAGETLVEVLASMFIFLIMFGILQGAVSYSSASMERNRQVREENRKILQGLQSASETTGDTQRISFVAVNSDFTVKGSLPVFGIDTVLAEKNATYQDKDGKEQTVTFYLYHTPQAAKNPDAATSVESGGDADE